MNDIEIQRLAHALNDLRPSWPISSLTTFIKRNLAGRVYRDAAVALVYVALDVDAAGNPVTETPKRVLESGPWWKAAEVNGNANTRPTPPKRHEQCLDCGRHLDACLCGNRTTRLTRGDTEAGLAACRAAVRQTPTVDDEPEESA